MSGNTETLSREARAIIGAQDPALLREADATIEPTSAKPADDNLSADAKRIVNLQRHGASAQTAAPAKSADAPDNLSEDARRIVHLQRHGTPAPKAETPALPAQQDAATPAASPAAKPAPITPKEASAPTPTAVSRPASKPAQAALPAPGTAGRAEALAAMGARYGRPAMLKAMTDAEREEDRQRISAAIANSNAERADLHSKVQS